MFTIIVVTKNPRTKPDANPPTALTLSPMLASKFLKKKSIPSLK